MGRTRCSAVPWVGSLGRRLRAADERAFWAPDDGLGGARELAEEPGQAALFNQVLAVREAAPGQWRRRTQGTLLPPEVRAELPAAEELQAAIERPVVGGVQLTIADAIAQLEDAERGGDA
jgi:hypothetical protein